MVTTNEENGIFYITLNRPEKRNAVNQTTASALLEAFKNFEKSENSMIGILHGNGGNFCAGYDLKELSSSSELPDSLADWNFKGQAPMVNQTR